MANTNYTKEIVAAALMRTADFPTYANVYLGLHSANPGGSGNYINEIVGTGYVRVNLSLTSGYPHTNDEVIQWVVGSLWSDVTYISVGDSSQGGNMLLFESITTITGPDVGTIIRIPIGNLTIS